MGVNNDAERETLLCQTMSLLCAEATYMVEQVSAVMAHIVMSEHNHFNFKRREE